MKPEELREMSREELEQRVREWKRKYMNLRFQHTSGQLQNTAEITKTRRDLARALTILREGPGEDRRGHA